MIGEPTKDSIKTDESETVNRNDQISQRVYDPQMHRMMSLMLDKLDKIEQHLSIISDEET